MIDRRELAIEILRARVRSSQRPQEKSLPGSWTNANWPEGLDVYPLVHGRGVPADAYRSQGSGMGFGANSAVFACLNTIGNAFREAPLEPMRIPDEGEAAGIGKLHVVRDHPIRKIIRTPNRTGPDDTYPVAISLGSMGWHMQWCLHVDGNAYWLMVRSGPDVSDNVLSLWPLPAHLVKPVAGKAKPGSSGDNFISYYEYDAFPGEYPPLKLDPRNVIHFKLNVDPNDIHRGLGPVKMLAREVASDEAATQYTNALLSNSAVPGLIVVPEDGYVEPEEAETIKRRLRSQFGPGNQGGIAVLSAGAKVEQFGYDPSRMTLGAIHKHVEERIAAVTNVPAMVAQLGAGLEQQSQFSNFHEAREMFTEDTILPLWTAAGEVLTGTLLPNFDGDPDLSLVYDTSVVRALQTDVTQQYARIQTAVRGGWLAANEARAMVGLPPIDVKAQQVPLTQGEDNRFNIMVEQGLVTVNEVRESIGLPPTEDGDLLLVEYTRIHGTPQAGNVADLEGFEEPGKEGSPGPVAGNASEAPRGEPQFESEREMPGATDNRPGSGLPPTKAMLLEMATKGADLDEVLRAWRAAQMAGTTLAISLAS